MFFNHLGYARCSFFGSLGHVVYIKFFIRISIGKQVLTDLFAMDRSRVTLTFSGLKLTNGTSVWGSVAMAHSSMRICRALSVLVRFGEAAAVQVHRIIS